MSSNLVVAFARGGAGGKAQSFDQGVFAVLAFHGQDGARQVALALIGLDIAKQIDGGKFLGHEVAKSQVDAFDRSFGIDGLRPELIEIAHDLLKRIGSLGQLSRSVGVREERGIAIGKELGEKRGKLETARAMLKELSIDQVARFTGLSREELQSLAGEIAPQG